jgi:hypothetical protein
MALLPFIALLALRKMLSADIGELAATVALALLANAFVCGALSNPHDRYGARMVWLAVFAVFLAMIQLYERSRRTGGRDILSARN